MAGFLFHEVVFGPVRSRRLGLSLGINLLPLHTKYCSFNCIYCECGWTPKNTPAAPHLPSREEVSRFLAQRLQQLAGEQYLPDSLTYAGNGEPTLHPDFAGIVDDTMLLRDQYAPGARVTVLSNASRIAVPAVFNALKKLDNNIQKLDAGDEKMFRLINNPFDPLPFDTLIDGLCRFNGDVIIQSMFLRGILKGEVVDNTTVSGVDAWLQHLVQIKPKLVMIYPVARETPVHGIEKIPLAELNTIAEKVRGAGLNVTVYE